MGDVEIGRGAPVPGKKVQQGRDRIQECIAGDGAISSINGPAPGIAASDLKPVTHVLLDLSFEAVEIGVVVPRESIHAADAGADRARRACQRPQIGRGRTVDRLGRVDVIGSEKLVHTPRPDVGSHRSQVRQDFVLDIEVPLHQVIALGVGLNIRNTQAEIVLRCGGEDIERLRRKRTRRKIRGRTIFGEWRSIGRELA